MYRSVLLALVFLTLLIPFPISSQPNSPKSSLRTHLNRARGRLSVKGIAPFDNTPTRVSHLVPLHRQDTLVWCWVATAKMLIEALNRSPAPSQCELLSMQYQVPCCMDARICFRVGHIAEISNLLKNFSNRGSRLDFMTTAEKFYEMIRLNPIVINTKEGGGHFVVATGMRYENSKWIVSINDPYKGSYETDYESLRLISNALLVIQ